jgi:hypothetical protein
LPFTSNAVAPLLSAHARDFFGIVGLSTKQEEVRKRTDALCCFEHGYLNLKKTLWNSISCINSYVEGDDSSKVGGGTDLLKFSQFEFSYATVDLIIRVCMLDILGGLIDIFSVQMSDFLNYHAVYKRLCLDQRYFCHKRREVKVRKCETSSV